jgi:hypothetical protein
MPHQVGQIYLVPTEVYPFIGIVIHSDNLSLPPIEEGVKDVVVSEVFHLPCLRSVNCVFIHCSNDEL